MNNKEFEKGELVIYMSKVEVKLEGETVWLTQAQMAQAFDTERSVIT